MKISRLAALPLSLSLACSPRESAPVSPVDRRVQQERHALEHHISDSDDLEVEQAPDSSGIKAESDSFPQGFGTADVRQPAVCNPNVIRNTEVLEFLAFLEKAIDAKRAVGVILLELEEGKDDNKYKEYKVAKSKLEFALRDLDRKLFSSAPSLDGADLACLNDNELSFILSRIRTNIGCIVTSCHFAGLLEMEYDECLKNFEAYDLLKLYSDLTGYSITELTEI